MYRRHGNKLGLVFLTCDLAMTAIAWFVAYFARFALLDAPGGVPNFHRVVAGLPLVLVLATLSYHLFAMYEVHRLRQLPRELGVVCKASGLLFVLIITMTFYRRDLYESRMALAGFLVLNVVGLTVARRLIWQALKYLRGRGLNHGRALIVGSGRTGQLVARTIRDNYWTGLEAVGFVDRPNNVEPSILPRLGQLDEIDSIVAEHDVDHVFVALPFSRYGELAEVYASLSDVLVEVQLVPDVPNLAGMKLRMTEIDGTAFLSLRANPHQGVGRVAKRAMDVTVGAIALLLLSPVMIGLAFAVKFTSAGPVFFRQSRDGQAGTTFEMLKFRSMRTDAERQSGPVWATRNDQRCTPLGRFMRRWSLDELPQLFNVLSGEMSLVGPRPERGVFVEQFRKEIPGYGLRHQVKSGITGWAQINGWRGSTSLRQRTRCDLYYIANWSVWLDLEILFLTVWKGFRHRNAY